MTHLQKAPRKPLLNVEQGKVFISHLDNDLHKGIAKNIFVDGMTNAEIADDYFYCQRQIERIRIGLLKTVLLRLIEKQVPKRPILGVIFPSGIKWWSCPVCKHNNIETNDRFCHQCGQALKWGDAE